MPLLKEGVQGEPSPYWALEKAHDQVLSEGLWSIGLCAKQTVEHPFPKDSLSPSPFPASIQ